MHLCRPTQYCILPATQREFNSSQCLSVPGTAALVPGMNTMSFCPQGQQTGKDDWNYSMVALTVHCTCTCTCTDQCMEFTLGLLHFNHQWKCICFGLLSCDIKY